MHQPFREVVLISLVDVHGHEEHALSAVSERLKQVPRVYVEALRQWMQAVCVSWMVSEKGRNQ